MWTLQGAGRVFLFLPRLQDATTAEALRGRRLGRLGQSLQENSCLSQNRRIEPLGEPIVDRREQIARL